MNLRPLPPAGLALVFLTLGGCGGGGGGGGGGNTGALKLASVNGTWSVAETVTSSTFEGFSGPGCEDVDDTYTYFLNLENTTGSTVVATDPQVVGSPARTATASGRKITWKGTGDDAGDSVSLTLDSSDTLLTGTTVEVDDSLGVTCTTRSSFVATKVPTAPSISTGNWTFSYDSGLGTVALGTLALTQKFASVSASNSTASLLLARVGGEWQGMVRANSLGLLGDVVGNFNAAGTEFTGTYDTGVGSFDITGEKTTTGGSLCSTIDTSAVWDLTFRPNLGPVIDFLGGTMTQIGCDVTCSFPAQGTFAAFTLSGSLNGQAWTALQSGGGIEVDRRFSGTFSGNPATSLDGSFFNVRSQSDGGTITLTKRTTGGGGCATIDTSNVWDLVQTFNGGSANYSGGTMTQTGCDVTFDYPGSTPFTFSGTVSGNTWTALQGGVNAAPDRRYTGTFTGNPATSLTGSFTNVANGGDFGTITLTKRTCRSVDPGSWTISLSGGPLNTFFFDNGALTQTGCSIRFNWTDTMSSPALTARWDGTIAGNNLSMSNTSGSWFTFYGTGLTLSGTLSGDPANSWSGTYTSGGVFAGTGNFTATRN